MQESWIVDPPRRGSNFDFVACGLLFLASAIVRLYFVHASQDVVWLRTPWPGGDVDLYWRAAVQLRQGMPFDPSFEFGMISAPVFVLWLAVTQSIVGESLLAHRVLAALTFSLTPVVVYRIGSLIFRDRPSAVAGAILLLLLPSAVFFDTMVMPASLELALLALLIHQLVTLSPDRSVGELAFHGVRCGVLLALLFLLSQVTLLYTLVSATYIARRTDLRLSSRRILLAGAVSLLALAAVTWAARETFFGPSSFPPASGILARAGTGDDATGYPTSLAGLPNSAVGRSFVARMDAEVRHDRLLTLSEANSAHWRDAWRDATASPLRTIGLAFDEFEIFLNDFEPADEHFLLYIERTTPFIRRVPGRFGLLVAFGAVGMLSILSRESRQDVTLLLSFLAAVVVASLVTYVTWRTRLGAVIPLSLLAGAGISLGVELLSEWQTRRYTWRPLIVRRTIAVVIVGCLSGWFGFRTLQAVDLGFWFRTAERNVAASRAAERTTRSLDGRYAASKLESDAEWIARARLLKNLERHSEAFDVLTRLVAERGSSDSWVHGQYLTYLLWRGDVEVVRGYLARLSEQDPALLDLIIRRRTPLEQRFLDRFVGPLGRTVGAVSGELGAGVPHSARSRQRSPA